MRFLLPTFLLNLLANHPWADSIYYRNTTATITTVFNEMPGQPIYTQKMDNHIPSFKFKRGQNSIIIKDRNRGIELP